MIEMRHLRYFLAIVEEGQISRAAGRLHIAQPALSQAIRQLEREVGVELLVRHPRGVAPSAAGVAFASKARAALDLVSQSVDAALARRPNRPLLVGFLPPWNDVANDVVAAAAAACPGGEAQLQEVAPGAPLGAVVDGRLDAAFVWEPFDAPEVVLEP